MKTSLLKVMKTVALASMTIMLANCSNSGGGSSTSTVGTYAVSANYCTPTSGSGGYVIYNGVCYVNGAAQSSTALCTSAGTYYTYTNGTCYANTTTGTGTYTYINGSCYNTATNQYVATSLCSSSSCNGTYYYSNYAGQSVAISCSPTSGISGYTYANQLLYSSTSNGQIYNCSGLRLMQAGTNSIVTCQ